MHVCARVCVCALSFGKHTDTSVWDYVKKTDGSRRMDVLSVNIHLSLSPSILQRCSPPPDQVYLYPPLLIILLPTSLSSSPPPLLYLLLSSSCFFFSADWRLLRTELACNVLPDPHISQWIACARVCACVSASTHG